MMKYGQGASSLGISMVQGGATDINAALNKNAKGDLPEGANITKVIVDGYKDGVLIAGAAYLGPAASIGKVVAGGTIAEIANGTYQWFDINSEQNQSLPESQRKTWDYWSSANAGITGMLGPVLDGHLVRLLELLHTSIHCYPRYGKPAAGRGRPEPGYGTCEPDVKSDIR